MLSDIVMAIAILLVMVAMAAREMRIESLTSKKEMTAEEEFEELIADYLARNIKTDRNKVIAQLTSEGITIDSIRNRKKKRIFDISMISVFGLVIAFVIGMIISIPIQWAIRVAHDREVVEQLIRGERTYNEAVFTIKSLKFLKFLVPAGIGGLLFIFGGGWGIYGIAFAAGGIVSEMIIMPAIMGW